MIKGIWSSIFILLFCVACTEEPSSKLADNQEEIPTVIRPRQFDSVYIHTIDSFFTQYQKAGIFNGNVLGYNDGRMHKASFGVADYIKKTPLSDSSLFQLASVSKPLTAVAIMTLVQEGKLHLSDSVQHLLPGFPYPGITLSMLLSHRSGLSNYMYITDSLWLDQSIALPNANMVDTFFTHAPMRYYPPNLKYNYSNTNYFLLAAIAERVTHQSFEELMQERVFTPADMVQSRVYNGMQMDTLPHIARGSENRRWHIADFYLNGVTGDKGTYSTTGDLLNLHLALQGNALLSDSIQKVMYTAQSEYKRNKSYALGWRVMQATETHPEICYHFGWWRGYRSYFIRIPSQNKCLVALCNLSKGEFLPKKDLIDLLMKK